MNFIKKIVDNEIDDLVHIQFQKFSRGEFKDRAILKVKKSKNKYTINSSGEFINEFVRIMAEKLGSQKTKITGAIITTANLTDKLNFKDKKQFRGVIRYLLDTEMSGDEIIKLLDEFPKAICALSFKVGEDAFAGNGLKGKQLYRAVKPNDIAPTLSAIVNAKSPSGANGDILEEVLAAIK